MKKTKPKVKICAYCTIPEIRARTIIENKLAWAFPTNIPIVPGHVLISPKRCVQKFEDLTKKETESIFDLLNQLNQVDFVALNFLILNYLH